MQLPDFKLIGEPSRFKNGHDKQARHFAQRFRLLGDTSRKIRSVSLQTTDKTVARRRAVSRVEAKVFELTMVRNLNFRTEHGSIQAVLDEYVDDLLANGNTEKQAELVQGRIELVIEKAGFIEYAQVDAVQVVKAIKDLQDKGQFQATSTANKYLEAVRAWTRWVLMHERWDRDPLAAARRIKGDTSNTRPRTILSQEAFTKLLRVTRGQPNRRNLSGEQRYWLYLIASQTGLRAQELHSLTPAKASKTSCLFLQLPSSFTTFLFAWSLDRVSRRDSSWFLGQIRMMANIATAPTASNATQ